jgi:hypothetical protein
MEFPLVLGSLCQASEFLDPRGRAVRVLPLPPSPGRKHKAGFHGGAKPRSAAEPVQADQRRRPWVGLLLQAAVHEVPAPGAKGDGLNDDQHRPRAIHSAN